MLWLKGRGRGSRGSNRSGKLDGSRESVGGLFDFVYERAIAIIHISV